MMRRLWRNALAMAAAGSFLALSLLASAPAAHAVGGEPSIKIGLDRLSMTGAKYTHETLAGGAEEKNTDALSGADVFIEWVASDHFGLEIAGTVAPLERSYKLGDTTPVSDNVNESASFATVGVNLYFTKATRKGFQSSIGVATGTLAVKHEFEGGSLGKASSSASFAITAVKFGVEWITELAGVRLQYQSTTGASSNTTELAGVKQTVDYTGGILALGVYAFF